jgi:hypothetical protein
LTALIRLGTHVHWIEPEEVDRFKDDVANSEERKVSRHLPNVLLSISLSQREKAMNQDTITNLAVDPDLTGDIAWLNVNEINDLKKCADLCVDRWKAAGPDARKKMFDLFTVAGIFLCGCHHGHMILICDMIRSGELYMHCI